MVDNELFTLSDEYLEMNDDENFSDFELTPEEMKSSENFLKRKIDYSLVFDDYPKQSGRGKRKYSATSIQDDEKVKKRAKKCVRFSLDSKVHDGLIFENRQFENLLSLILNRRDVESFNKSCFRIATESDSREQFRSLRDKTTDLIERIRKTDGKVPILPNGGGYAYKISHTHLSSLQSIQSHFEDLITP